MSSFGRYTLLDLIGKGGMAEIWSAKIAGPEGFEKVLAIKKILPDLANDPEFVSMFVEEAKLVATLAHPNIVPVFDFGKADGQLFFAMEYVTGTNLARLLQRISDAGMKLPVEVALYIAVECCRGLGYAHSRPDPIVHRDVSPQNVLVSSGGEVKVTDFGIAKIVGSLNRTAAGQVRGKVAYLSPEQARMLVLDARSDLFSLGLVLYEMLARKRLFLGDTPQATYGQILAFRRLDERALEGIPAKMHSLLRTAVSPELERRWPNAAEMEAALGDVIGVGGLILARQSLAALVQRLFDSEASAASTSLIVTPDGTVSSAETGVVPMAETAPEMTASASITADRGASPDLRVTTADSAARVRPRPQADETRIRARPQVDETRIRARPQADETRIRARPPGGPKRAFIIGSAIFAALGGVLTGRYALGPAKLAATSTPPIHSLPTAVPSEEPAEVVLTTPARTRVPVTATPAPTPFAGRTEASTTATVAATPAKTPRPTEVAIATTPVRTPVVLRSAVPVRTATPAPTTVALAKPADFVVGTDPGIYVIVHVDGKSLESPVNVRLPPGEYQVRFENKKLGFDQTTTVVVGGTTTLVKFHVAKGVNNKLVLERRSIVVEDLSGVPVIDDADEMPIVGD